MKHDLHAAPQRRGGRHSPKMAYQYGDLTPSGHSLTGVSQTGQCSHSENSRSKRYSLFLLTKYLRSTISSAYSR
jgi:hypothetical protein